MLHSKLLEIKKRAKAINYSSVSVSIDGKLEERENLLDKRIVEGYGVMWGSKNSYDEIVHKGAYSQSISDNGPQSNANYQIKFRDEHGRACALFEELREDEYGLYFRTKPLDDVSWADDLLTQLRSGTINNFSIGFNYIWDQNAMKYDDATGTINIFKARLFEISAVAIPSDMETFALRGMDDIENVSEQIEDFISNLPKKDRLKARHLFSGLQALAFNEPAKPVVKEEPQEVRSKGIDYNYLLTKLNLQI